MKPKIMTQKIGVSLTNKQYKFLQEQAIIQKKPVAVIAREIIEKERSEWKIKTK